MTKINGGATLWARQTLDSKIFCNKPHVWFKIWFYLITKANHKDNKQFKRGSCFMKYDWIMQKTRAKKSELDHAMRWFRFGKMIATTKAIRGFNLTILNYNTFQTLNSYKSDTKSDSKSDTKAIQKRNESDTINKYGIYNNNDKNNKEIKEVRNQVSASLKEKPVKEERKANNIEFDQELLSWHGVDEDIIDDWEKRFPDIDVPVELMKIREHFKFNPKKEKGIKNFAIYINDWLERAEKYRIDDNNKEEGGN